MNLKDNMKQNYFSKRMTPKSDSELIEIISSDSFVEEAKQAAAWELDKRKIEHDYKSSEPKQISNDFSKDYDFNPKESKGWRKYHENRLLFFGLACLACTIYIIVPTIFTFKTSLMRVDGRFQSADIMIEDVSSFNRAGYEAKTRKATLYFSLIGINKRFELMENIGQDYRHDKFSSIKKKLRNSKQITVWIKKGEKELSKPKVFQIDIDNRTVLTFNEVKTEHNGIFAFLLILGLGSTGFVLWRRYPDKFERIINGKPAANTRS